MSMGSRDSKKRWRNLLCSFNFAIQGILHVVKHERNMKIHLVATMIAISLSFLLSISKVEFIIILLLCGIVLSLEAVNTAIERTVDLVTEEHHPLAKAAKDVAAGAVFIFVILAVIIGLIIFYVPLIAFFQK